MDSDREAAEGTQQLGLAPPFARGLTGLSGVTTRPAGYPQWWGTTSDREASTYYGHGAAWFTQGTCPPRRGACSRILRF